MSLNDFMALSDIIIISALVISLFFIIPKIFYKINPGWTIIILLAFFNAIIYRASLLLTNYQSLTGQ